MGTVNFKGTPVETAGDLPAVGDKAPNFTLIKRDLSQVSLRELDGTLVLNVFPSIDTGVCATSVRKFNERAASLDGVRVFNVSMDLPFALSRFCGAEGIENVDSLSAFRGSFLASYGLTMISGPLAGLAARAVIVIGPDKTVKYTELVPEIAQEPNYDAALAAAK